MRFPWDRRLDEEARKQRGKLAEEIVRNDRVRNRLIQKTRETPIGDMMTDMFKRLDEARRD